MRQLSTLLIALLTLIPAWGQSDLVITGVADGSLTGGLPKAIELYVINNVPDLSVYGVGCANNGGGTDSVEFAFPAVAASAGDYIYVTNDTARFRAFFGIAADYLSTKIDGNGDDAYELFLNGVAVDVFGDINVDGTGTPWEYLDSWAYRNSNTGPDGTTFQLGSWSFGGINVYDPVTTNAAANPAQPTGTYTKVVANNVTFRVDLSQYAGTFTGAFVNGDFNGWCGSCNPMSDADNDGIWEVQLPLTADSIEYKFTLDGWNTQENLTPGTPCTKTTGAFTNRFLVITGDTVLQAVCWESCSTCSTPPAVKQVTFQVDLSKYTGAFTSAYVNGNFNGWCGSCNPMTDANADGIWEVTLPLTADSIEYKFTLDGWNIQENFAPGDPCTKTSFGFTNRFQILTGDVTLPAVCWESCSPCSAVVVKNVTFQVDLSQYTGSFGGAFLNGTFNNWCGSCNPMTDANADGIWDVTLPLTADSIEYKFTLDGWNIAEQFVGGESCTKTTGGFTNRFIIFSGDTTIPVVCWESCSACPAPPVTYNNIGDYKGVDASGVADSVGANVRFKGIVTSVDFRGNGLEFFIQDATGGLGLFNSSKTFGYTVAIGDSVEVSGPISQFNGLIQVSALDTVILLGQGVVPAPMVVDSLGEATEGMLIRINGATVVNPSQWPTAAGQSRSVDIQVGARVLTLRIDADTDIDGNVAAPTGPFDVIGIGSQFDNSNPFTSGYQILPRLQSDIMPQPVVTFDNIADYSGVDGNGEPDSVGVMVRFKGVVTCVDLDGNAGLEFALQDATGGMPMFNFADVDVNGAPYVVTMGDELEVYGAIQGSRGLTRLFLDSIVVVSSGNALPAPALVTTLNESTEGELIRINGATLLNPSQWPAPGSNANIQIVVNNDTLTLRIDRDTEVDDSVSTPNGPFNIVGIGWQFGSTSPWLSGYQIIPRIPSDIESQPSTVGQPCADLYFSEYLEGSGSNKVLEIYNPTNTTIDLSAYRMERFNNGATSGAYVFQPVGTIAPGGVFIVANPSADPAILAKADTTNDITFYNGDDAITLMKGIDTLDIIGKVGEDPGTNWTVGTGATSEYTLVRKSSVFNGTTNWALSTTQWDVYPQNFSDSLGSHYQLPCSTQLPAELFFVAATQDLEEAQGPASANVGIANPDAVNATTVEVYVKGGTAVNGTDYQFADTTITFPAGSSNPVNLSVAIIDNAIQEPNRTIILGLRNATAGATISIDSMVITILDDDTPLPVYTIAQVHTENADGVADSLAVECELRGVVTSLDFDGNAGLSFYITDGTGSINVFNFVDVSNYVVTPGDSIHVQGVIEQFRGLTEIIPDSIGVISQGNPVPAPRLVTDLDESTESELVQMYGLSIVDTNEWTNSGSGFNVRFMNAAATDTFLIRIDNDSEVFGTAKPTAGAYYIITGIGNQFNPTATAPFLDGYQLLPRYISDIEEILAPQADFSTTDLGNRAYDFTDLSTNNPTEWEWNFGDGSAVVNTQNANHTYGADGMYQVCLTAGNVAGSSTDCDSVTVVTVGLDADLANGLQLFPNPVTTDLQVQSANVMQQIQVVNTAGQMVLRAQVGSTVTRIPVAALPAGQYFIVIRFEEGEVVRSFQKQ